MSSESELRLMAVSLQVSLMSLSLICCGGVLFFSNFFGDGFDCGEIYSADVVNFIEEAVNLGGDELYKIVVKE